MKNGMYWGIAVFALATVLSGCQSRSFINVGEDSKGNAYAVPANSVDGYAKAHGISRQEAAKRMREQFVPADDSQIAEKATETTTK
jgi:hypothetical protein